jgi:hypothetical protein
MKPDVLSVVKRTENIIFMKNTIVLMLIGYPVAMRFKNHNVARK